MSCKPYFDMNGFFTNKTHNSSEMLGVCDLSKILQINYFDRSKPSNLYTVNSTGNSSEFASVPFVEGFTSGGPPGENNTNGHCPDGHTNKNGRCKQVCTSCDYNDRMKDKSRQFNQYDNCFSEGVYNGTTNNGKTTCTCGKNNQYCSDNFLTKLYTTDGMFFNKDNIIVNIADANDMENYALF